MPPEAAAEQTHEEQAAAFTTEAFHDGAVADGAPTEAENAAAAANAAKPAAGTDAAASEDDAGAGTVAKAGDAQPTAEEAAAAEAKKAGGKTGSARIGELTAKYRTEERRATSAEARATAAEAELAALKSGKAPLTADNSGATTAPGAPDPSKFDYGELDPKYIAALARFETNEALKADKAETEKSRQAVAADAKRQEMATKTTALVTAGVALHDDFDEVVMQGAANGSWELSQTLGELLLDSEFGPQIAYELASDPDEALRVSKLSPAQQAAFFGRQEAKFEASKPSQASATTPKVPKAQTPPKLPKGGSGSNTVEADSSDFAAVEKAWQTGALH